ncbi:MAG: hypothetical protein KY462_16295 [Actinobacteria bacterium]|nr:hypothetical protein [Actinomycetota bacterium]
MHDHPDTIIDDLDHEWQRLLATGSVDRALAGWRHEDVRLVAFSSTTELFLFLEDPRTPCCSQDDVLVALLTIGRRDPLASRVVLQRFVPALKRMVAWDQPFPISEWACHVVAEAFEVAATYPVERRPERVAANVVMDVRKRLYALLADHQTSQAELAHQPFIGVAAVPDPAEGIEAAQLIDWGRRETGLRPDVAALIVATRVLGFTVKELAHRLGVPSARLRQRISRGEQRFREVVPAV